MVLDTETIKRAVEKAKTNSTPTVSEREPTQQEMIVRQNALTQANSLLGHRVGEYSVEDALLLAEQFEEWVHRRVKE